jgi:hypothetical protein
LAIQVKKILLAGCCIVATFFSGLALPRASQLMAVLTGREFLDCALRADLIVVGEITDIQSRDSRLSVTVVRAIKGDAPEHFVARIGGIDPYATERAIAVGEPVVLMVVRDVSGGDQHQSHWSMCGAYHDGIWPKRQDNVNIWPYSIPSPTLEQIEALAARASRLDPKDESGIAAFLTEMWHSGEPFQRLFVYRYLRHPERDSLRSSFQEEMAAYEPPFLMPGSVEPARPKAAPQDGATVAVPLSAGPLPLDVSQTARGAVSVPRAVNAGAPVASTAVPVADTPARPPARDSARFGTRTALVAGGLAIAVGAAILFLRCRRRARGG